MTREKLMDLAAGIVNMATARILNRRAERRGVRLVVIVTDENGHWCGVAHNTNPRVATTMLSSALSAVTGKARTRMVIDAQGEEAR